MHLGNGAVTPECAIITWGAAAAGLGLLAWRKPTAKPIVTNPLEVGCLAALVFALQAVNVPLLPWASAHLVGGVLLIRLLGPALGAWLMATVLLVQALAMGDGGLLAWGCNVLNMALVPAVVLMGFERLGATRWNASAAAAASVIAAAVLIPLETAAGRSTLPAGWTDFASAMVVTHVIVALFEGAMTFALLTAVDRLQKSPGKVRLATAFAAAALAVVAVLFASSLPDGYESAAESTGFAALLADAPATADGWVQSLVQRQTQIVGGIQTLVSSEWLVVFGATLSIGAVAALAALIASPKRTVFAIPAR